MRSTLWGSSYFVFCKQKTAYEIVSGDWSSDVCSSDLARYRELTGFDEAQVNPAVLTYFLVLGVIGTVRRLLEGGVAFARGENHLLASLFNIASVQFGHMMWMQAMAELEPVLTSS